MKRQRNTQRRQDMKRHLIYICIAGLLLSSCQTQITEERCPLRLTLHLPELDEATSLSIKDKQVVFNDLNMGRQYTVDTDSIVWQDTLLFVSATQPVGFYDIDVSVTLQADSAELLFRTYIKGLALTEARSIEDRLMPVAAREDFVLAEIFTPGTQTPEGKTYTGDRYFVVFNNSADTLYADGLVLLESKLKNTQKYTLTPDFREESFAADAIYRIPGDGTEYPVPAGGSILIVDNAMDHRPANSNSFDLSDADFEWYDQSTSASITDLDNPDVPNMDKIFCYSLTIWIPNNQGNTSFALARFPDTLTTDGYLTQYKFRYNYLNVTSAGTFNMSADTYLVPNEWVVDAVNLCPRTAYQWTATSPALDGGYTYVGELGSDKKRFGKSVRRKTLYNNATRRVLQDTNNSTYDFLPAQDADPHYFANHKQ